MKIKFITGDPHVEKYFPPTPMSKARPDWYNNLGGWLGEAHNSWPTIKKCMPVYDLITAGYMIYNPVEQEIVRADKEGHPDVKKFMRRYPMAWERQDPQEGHDYSQCPVAHKGEKQDYVTFSVPWRIETPPGYSCLIMQPFYNMEDRFTVFPALVDTDVIDVPWNNWPGQVHKDRVLIEPGAPLVQVIPFKREDWDMEVEYDPASDNRDTGLKFWLGNAYARMFHKKKKFK